MSPPLPASLLDQIHDLTLACLSGEADSQEVAALNELLRSNKTARRIYAHAILDSIRLHQWATSTKMCSGETFGECDPDLSFLTSAISDAEVIAATPFCGNAENIALGAIQDTGPTKLPSLPIHSSFSYLNTGWPLAYFIATVIFAIGAVIGSFTYVSHPGELASGRWTEGSGFRNPEIPKFQNPLPKATSVGQITGMVECKSTETDQISRDVMLGSTYRLASGLLEITYNSGAKVILQGPVVYEVDSADGGSLSVGKLTARVEKSTEYGVRSTEEADSGNPTSAIRHSPSSSPSPLSPLPSPLFSVKTPTAIVTDLGTEFGVEVDQQGQTISHVFRGSIKVQHLGREGGSAVSERILYENESVSVMLHDNTCDFTTPPNVAFLGFIRTLPKHAAERTIKTFDLADVVAGGDGFSGRRGRGIDSTNGMPTTNTLGTPKSTNEEDISRFRILGDGKYHRAVGLPFIDGVFIPFSREGGVQVDSAGHVVTDFFTMCNTAAGNIWAGGVVPVPTSSMSHHVAALLQPLSPSQTLMPTVLNGIDYASEPHGLIFLPANNGITFDLEAIRQANPSDQLMRFRAIAGNMEIASENKITDANADLLVLVDGRIAFRRRQFNKYMGAFPIQLPINPKDRFLTLAVTDGGNDIGFDWILFGDPVLEMSSYTSSATPTHDVKDNEQP